MYMIFRNHMILTTFTNSHNSIMRVECYRHDILTTLIQKKYIKTIIHK